MAPCCETPLTRIEKIKKNQIVNRGSSPYNQEPENRETANNVDLQNNNPAPVLPPEDMTVIIPPYMTDVDGAQPGLQNSNSTLPEVIPNAPTFSVPANPLLPEGYRETLDYNAVQYVNGFYRTQIGRYVRVEQLISNTVETKEGFLIGVGINYILLQEAATGNIVVMDIYAIKNMYVYYTYGANPFRPFQPTSQAMSASEALSPGSSEMEE